MGCWKLSPIQIAMLINMLMAVACAGGTATEAAPAPEATATPEPFVVVAPSSTPTVWTGGAAFGVEISHTPETRAQGLSGRPSLPEGYGMLFVFEYAAEHSFWMKDMLIPLDFVWISADCAAVDVTMDVPPPAPGTETGDLPLYRPSAPVLYVLEIDAGLVDELGIRVGDRVSFSGFSGSGVLC